MPAVALFAHPAGPGRVGRRGSHRRRVGYLRGGVPPSMPRCRNELRVHRLVRQDQKERARRLHRLLPPDPRDGLLGQDIGRISAVPGPDAVDARLSEDPVWALVPDWARAVSGASGYDATTIPIANGNNRGMSVMFASWFCRLRQPSLRRRNRADHARTSSHRVRRQLMASCRFARQSAGCRQPATQRPARPAF